MKVLWNGWQNRLLDLHRQFCIIWAFLGVFERRLSVWHSILAMETIAFIASLVGSGKDKQLTHYVCYKLHNYADRYVLRIHCI
jgi:hypothetical protein